MARDAWLHGSHNRGAVRYFLTFSSHRLTGVFTSGEPVARTLVEVLRVAERERFAILAYCFMPHYLHLLVEGITPHADLGLFVKVAKHCSGRAHAAVSGTPLWQEGHRERALRRQDDVRVAARYVLENPVRAGLVRTPLEYPYLGSTVWPVRELFDTPQR
jgi:REP element-mobilizing transposase RayT